MSFAFQPRSCHPAWWLRLLAFELLACFGLMLGAGSTWAAAMPAGVVPNSLVPSAGDSNAAEPSGVTPGAGDDSAPMCDTDGASVAAGIEIPEIDRGHFDALPFDALPCETQLLISGWRLDDPALGCKASFDEHESPPPGPPQMPRPRFDGIREMSVPFPERAEPALVLSDDGEGLEPSRGHSPSLFRPPVTRA